MTLLPLSEPITYVYMPNYSFTLSVMALNKSYYAYLVDGVHQVGFDFTRCTGNKLDVHSNNLQKCNCGL